MQQADLSYAIVWFEPRWVSWPTSGR